MPGGRHSGTGQQSQSRGFDIITNQPTRDVPVPRHETPHLVQQFSGNVALQHGDLNPQAPVPGHPTQRSNIVPQGPTPEHQQQTSYGHGREDDYQQQMNHHQTSSGYGSSAMQPGGRDERHQHQMQSQEHMLRNAQASKQMVYEVYGNAITMLEELEHRELKLQGADSMARSDIYLPNQSGYDAATIQRKLDAQLLLVQSQLVSCDRQIREDVREELKVRTLDWASQRQASNLRQGLADKYAGKLFEVLESGRTDHPREFDTAPSMSERDMQRAMHAYMQGSQRRTDLDDGFRKDPNRLAVAPNIRVGAGTSLGAERILQARPEMRHALEKYSRNIR